MIRNLKILLFAAAALVALGALSASGAHAAEFHCSVEPCRYTLKPDGAAGTKTAHQVLVVKKGEESILVTCNKVEGEGTSSTKTTKELTITQLAFLPCVVNSAEVASIRTNQCDYLYTSAGEFGLKCPAGQGLEFSFSGCTVRFEPQGPLPGLKYHDAGTTKSELTVETAVQGLKGELIGTKAGCGVEPGAFTEGEYKTGNAILTGETDNAEAKMANVWWE